jgi:hypothetical protein
MGVGAFVFLRSSASFFFFNLFFSFIIHMCIDLQLLIAISECMLALRITSLRFWEQGRLDPTVEGKTWGPKTCRISNQMPPLRPSIFLFLNPTQNPTRTLLFI